MKETFILANGINGTELKRMLARRGINTFCWRIYNTLQLAKEILNRSNFSIDFKLIDANEEVSIIYSLLSDLEYFKNTDYSDAKNISRAFRTLRSQVVDSDELKFLQNKLLPGVFPEKNQSLIDLLKKYLNYLNNNNLIDSVGLINLAIKNANSINADFLYLHDICEKPNPIEKRLLDAASDNNWKTVSIIDLFDVFPENSKIEHNLVSAYGSINEVESIIDDIYSNHHLDECVVACSNVASYSQYFYNLSLLYNIPITFGCGVSIKNSNPAKLLSVILKWDNSGYHGIDAIREIFNNEAFDILKFWNFINHNADFDYKTLDDLAIQAGNLKLSTDKNHNDEVLSKHKKSDLIFKLAEAFELGVVAFVEKFVKIRSGRFEAFDTSSMYCIKNTFDTFVQYNPQSYITVIYDDIMSGFVCKEVSKPGYLHITDINSINSMLRENVYICGLDANEFPGKAIEDYLLLDCDIEIFEDAATSQKKVLNKIKSFNKTIELVNSLKLNLNLSFSSYDTIDLKEQNASSVLYDMYSDIDSSAKKCGFFDAHLSVSSGLINKYKDGYDINYSWDPYNFKIDDDLFLRSWSPSAIEQYFSCPRSFFLNYVLRIPQDDINDPFDVIDPATLGTIAHELMKYLGENKQISKSEFLQTCSEAFTKEAENKDAIIKSDKQNAKNVFLQMMDKAYDADILNEAQILAAEQSITAKYEDTKIILHGYVDRIESLNGNSKVIDFKTGNFIKQEDNKPEKCLQALIYAYIWNATHENNSVVEGQYRYLKTGETITCRWDQNSKDYLDEAIRQFEQALTNSDFPRCPSNSCKFCSYSDICLWPNEVDAECDEDD